MARPNPTDGGKVVPLKLRDEQVERLRGDLKACLEGRKDDLPLLSDEALVAKSRREMDAYERLLTALDRREVALPDEAARFAVEGLMIGSDEGSEYAEVIATHDAIFGLLAQLGGVKVEGS